MNGEIIIIQLPEEMSGYRLDKALRILYPELSRSQWQRLVRSGEVTMKGAPVRANYKVVGGETVRAHMPPPEPSDIIPEDIPLDLIYEDDDMMAINKPAGLVMHPAVGHLSGTLANAVVFHYPDVLDVGGVRRPGLVHRLDKDTSGVVLVAKNDRALNYLISQFKDRTVKKVYMALVDGHISPERALIDAPIGRNPDERKRMAVLEPGRTASVQPSQTRYELTEMFDEHSLVTCYPVTGRTHQIRVHLAYIGYPIVGDYIYGRRRPSIRLGRHFLHASRITFKRASDEMELTLEAPLPANLQQALSTLRENTPTIEDEG
ncbi:MAG: RluA family pseudouridine synthase [Chloroflexota bacterium]